MYGFGSTHLVLANDQHIVANYSLLWIDAAMTDGQMTHAKAFSHIDYCDIR